MIHIPIALARDKPHLKCERCGKRGVRRDCGNVTCADCPCWCWDTPTEETSR